MGFKLIFMKILNLLQVLTKWKIKDPFECEKNMGFLESRLELKLEKLKLKPFLLMVDMSIIVFLI